MEKMQASEAQSALDKLNVDIAEPWSLQGDTLQKEFVFKSFNQDFSFMTALALYAEKVNHHPDWSNCHRRVTITMSTFDVEALPQK